MDHHKQSDRPLLLLGGAVVVLYGHFFELLFRAVSRERDPRRQQRARRSTM